MRLLHLTEAAKRLACSVDDLLDRGAKGRLRFVFALPAATNVLLKNRAGESSAPELMRIPNLAVLEPHHCEELLYLERTSIREFKSGLQMTFPRLPGTEETATVQIRMIEPATYDSRPMDGSTWASLSLRHWCAFYVASSAGHSIPASREDIRLFESDVQAQIEVKAGAAESAPAGAWESEKLTAMRFLARHYWSKAVRGDKSTYPDTGEIERHFMKRGMSKTLASAAATLIRPEFATVGRRPDE